MIAEAVAMSRGLLSGNVAVRRALAEIACFIAADCDRQQRMVNSGR